MKKTIIGALVGAVIIFIWQFVSFAAVQLHKPAENYTDKQTAILEFPKNQFPEDMNPQIGQQLMMSNGSGQSFPVTIMEVQEETVLLDANHPLAGQDLIFDIELVEIVPVSRIIMP